MAAAAPQAPQSPQPTNMPEQLPQIDPDTMLTDPAKWQAALEQRYAMYTQAMLQQAGGPVLQQLSDVLETQAKGNPANADVVGKFWPEVTQLVSQVPAQMRTAALYDKAVRLVRGEHFDELSAAKAAQLAAAGTGVEGVGGTGSSPAGDADGAVWDKIKATPLGERMLATSGKAGIRAAIANMRGETLESYADKLVKTRTKIDPSNPDRLETQLGGANG